MIGSILKFELISRFKWPLFYLFLGLMAFQSIWFIQGSYEVYINDATNMNGAALFYRSFAGGGIIMTIIIALITGSSLYKDIQYKSAPILYTTSISDKKFFVGRFLSAYVINLILGFGLLIGMSLAPYSGIGEPDNFGPTPWGQMIHGFLIFTATNLFVYTAISIAFLVLTRRMAASYLSIFFITLLFFICETLRPDSSNLELLQILDPSAFVYTTTIIDTIPADQKNYTYVPLTQMFFINRAVWIGISMLLLFIAYRVFSFKWFVSGFSKSKKRQIFGDKKTTSQIGVNFDVVIPKVHLNYRLTDFLRKMMRFTVLEVKNVVRTSGFKILILILSIIFIVKNLLWNSSFYIGPSYPLTSTMTLTRISMGTWVSIILMIWTTELLFKDKGVKFWQVKDALPVPVWVNILSKFLAMTAVTFLISCMFIIFGVIAQLIKGVPGEINMSLYITDLLGYNWGWLNYLQMLALVCLVAGLTANRFATHVISIWIYFFNMVSFDLKIIEDLRFIYMFVPGVDDYSEMNGYGIWATSIPWFFLLWTTLAIAFVLMGIYFWKRGASFQMSKKLTFRGTQLNWFGKGLIVVALSAFIYLNFFIKQNVHALGNFETEYQVREKDAAYEKKYKKLAASPQPVILGVDLELDFYPKNRSAMFNASYHLQNSSQERIDTLYLNFPDFTGYEELLWQGEKLQPVWTDLELNIMAIEIQMPADTTAILKIEGSRKHIGFTQDKWTQQPELTYNGSFLRARDLLPVIGYDDDRELMENRYRGELGLKKLGSRMPQVNDSIALSQDIYSPDAKWVTGTMELSTSENQVALGPGQLLRSWKKGGRNHYEYSLEKPAPYEWYFGSADYATAEFEHKGTKFGTYYKPEHAYNITFFQKTFSKTLDFIESELGGYPYTEVKLMEIPFYQEPHYTFPNTIALSEKEGWYADVDSFDNKVYMDFTLASDLMAHWVMQNVAMPNVQGADMLRYALPECLAIQVVENSYGDEGTDWLLTKKQGLYSRERGNEPNVEPPLLKADGIEYLERNKGTIELYRLSKKIGFGVFNGILRDWVLKSGDSPRTFEDLYLTIIKSEAFKGLKAEERSVISKAFETVTP